MSDLAHDDVLTETGPSPEPVVSEPRRGRFPSGPRLLVAALYAAAAVPVLYVLYRVHRAPALPYTDYWTAFVRVFNPDGSVHLRGFFTYQNEHPFVIPNAIYYIDAKFFEGTNQFCGYLSVVLALLAIFFLRRLLPEAMSAPMRAVMTFTMTAVLFCPSGLWNFVRGMSGAAWLTANLFCLAAILLAWRGRTVPATVLAAFSILSYGTGFGAPVAIALIALVRRDKWWRWALPLGLLAGAAAVYAATSNGGSTGSNTHDPALIASTFLSNVGMLWDPSGGSLSVIAGAAGLFLIGWSFWTVRSEPAFADLVPWWGVAVYSICAAGLISLARGQVSDGVGVQGRYSSLSGLFWIAVAVIALRVVLARKPSSVHVGALASTVLVFIAVSPALADQAMGLEPTQRLSAAALRFGASGPVRANVTPIAQVIPRLKALGDYPFNSSYSVGCGFKPGDTVTAKIRTLPLTYQNNTNGAVDVDAKAADGALRFTGWIRRGAGANCVLILDRTGKIVGGGVTKIPRSDIVRFGQASPPIGYDALTPIGQTGLRVVLGFDDGYWLQTPQPG
ncbi:MAG: hypothetical protein QOH52_416 [Pseudonocardiales bacterium]|nr:hypothetical protein [Pseudonocardiales bacterium]